MSKPSFVSNWKNPAPLLPPAPRMPPRAMRLVVFPRATKATAMVMISRITKMIGWLEMKDWVEKNADSRVPTVDLGVSFGGFAITRGMVSRIDVREAMIDAPLDELSQ